MNLDYGYSNFNKDKYNFANNKQPNSVWFISQMKYEILCLFTMFENSTYFYWNYVLKYKNRPGDNKCYKNTKC